MKRAMKLCGLGWLDSIMNNISQLDWLKENRVNSVEKRDYSWIFTFKTGDSVATETFWRIVNPERIVVTSSDHGELFGLKQPVDAAKCAMDELGNNTIVDYSCPEFCTDLILTFENKARLQFFNCSAGYESWRAINVTTNEEVISMGGGGLNIF